MKCPRCQALFSAIPDSSGTVVCASCGARLRTRGPRTDAPEPRRPAAARREIGAALARVSPVATAAPAQVPLRAPARSAADPAAEALREVLAEIRGVRRTQEEILALLQAPRARSRPHAEPESFFDESHPATAPAAPVRSGRRKSVLIVDDDEATRQEAAAAFEAAEVPVRAVGDGNGALAAIAADRPDVVVLELAMGGSMGGKDVVNMIKATMEWVDIPLVAYTRLPVANQKEARQIHGADELVNKAAGGAEALVQRVIALFRRG
jgi:CheY-like chemotaxis protein